METPYLIAHKVRGEPAFDIAIQMEVEGYDEPWWIIPTSGHRAYPYWSTKLNGDCLMYWAAEENPTDLSDVVPTMPPDWPDHYQCDIDADTLRSITIEDITKAQSLLRSLGLIKPKEPIRRRI